MKIVRRIHGKLLDISYNPWTSWVLIVGLVVSLIIGPSLPRLSMPPIFGTKTVETNIYGPLTARDVVRVYNDGETYYSSIVSTSLVANTDIYLTGHSSLPILSAGLHTNITLHADGTNNFSFASALPNSNYGVSLTYSSYDASLAALCYTNKSSSGFCVLGTGSESVDVSVWLK